MSEPRTIRERILRATTYFERREGIIMTTFNLSASFLEEQALPVILGVDADARTASARSAGVHQELAVTPCTVFYDPSTGPNVSGRYRYVARPVPVRDRFFHPKLVVVAGIAEGLSWVYLAVSSANLTLSGWGRNAESFGETWVHTRRQQSWHVLDRFLSWLAEHTPLGETRGDGDAVGRVRVVLDQMPDRRRLRDAEGVPWSGTLYGSVYVSVVDKAGFPQFLRLGRKRRPRKLWAHSPYWSDVNANVGAFGAWTTTLVPALSIDGKKLGLTRKEAAGLGSSIQVRRNDKQIGDRFWHMKAYRILHGDRRYTAVGSCNFTRAGLAGGDGNIEAMLVYEADGSWLADGIDVSPDDLAEEPVSEEETPMAVPVVVVVAYDWRRRHWRWHVDPGLGQKDFRLHLPQLPPFAVVTGTDTVAGDPPPRGASFVVTYRDTEGDLQRWKGQVVEINLDYSSRVYGKPLSANEILDSWLSRAPAWDIGGGGDGDGRDDVDDADIEQPAAFDAVNLYDFYRAMRSLRGRLNELGEDREAVGRAMLVGRPDSVIALCHLANREGEAPIVRYLVLRELCRVVERWRHLVEEDLVHQAREMAETARTRTLTRLVGEMNGDAKKAGAVLCWFEKRFAELGAV